MSLTPYQQLVMKVLEEDETFDHWCLDPRSMAGGLGSAHAEVPGTKLFTYYTKDGVLHATRVGLTQIINQITWPPSTTWPPSEEKKE